MNKLRSEPLIHVPLSQQRSQWHDVVGAHCPRFATPSTVALPLPQPTGMDQASDYKMQLAFDGDRVVTPWIQILGRKAPVAPVLIVELTRSGDALVSVSAWVESLPRHDPHYIRVKNEFGDPKSWPKHLPVRYRWRARHEVDSFRGLFVMFVAGAGAMALATISIGKTYKKQVAAFLDDVAGETPRSGAHGYGPAPAVSSGSARYGDGGSASARFSDGGSARFSGGGGGGFAKAD